MKIRFYLAMTAFLSFLTISSAHAQDHPVQIYPQVQELTPTGDAFEFDGFELKKANRWEALIHRTPENEMLVADGLPLQLELKKNIEAWKDSKNIAKAEGAYDLKVTKKQVTISARDSVGIFYGLQTLRQLVDGSKIYPVEIHDFPTVKYRGVVEGFYGTPWSQADRISQIKFYGRIKANTYIYGPKDDPYHSSPNWRKPYPPKQAANIKKLVKVANANFVDFVWAIHPGQDIKWNEEDRQKVLAKFQSMYDLGVRSFAVFFDDISGAGTDAHKQAALLNYLTDHFVKVKEGVKPLILTPTEYNKSWANPDMKDGYLAILGKELDPSTQIMWTGDHVMSDVTKSTLAWVQKRIQRPALFWWNFPVSDYARDQLFIGPSYGLEKGVNAHELAGVLSNPMEHAEASKPAIFGVADYGWNTSAYQPEQSWEQALKIMLPHSYKAYQLFGENNSNPRHGITSYIGKESKDIAPYLERLKKGIKGDSVNKKDMIFAEGYFFNIREAGKKIIDANDDPMLLAEVTPWLNNFTALGQEGLYQLENYKFHTLQPKAYWNHIVSRLQQSNYWKSESYIAGDGTKTTPETGTRVLKPFVNFLFRWNSQKLFEKIVGKEGVKNKNLALGTIHTNIGPLKDSRFYVINEKELGLRPNKKSFTFEPDSYFTLELSDALNQAKISLSYKAKEKPEWQIEISENGKNWHTPKQNKRKGKMEAKVNQSFKFVRVAGQSTKSVSLELNGLTISKEGHHTGEQPFTTRDFDLSTAYTLKPGEKLVEKSWIDHQPKKAIILTNANHSALQISAKKDGKWKALPQTFKGKYIVVELPQTSSNKIRIVGRENVQVYEVLWK